MRRYLMLGISLGCAAVSGIAAERGEGVLAVHGGFAPDRAKLTPKLTQTFCRELKKSLTAGFQKLTQGKTSLDAVEASVKILEDAPEFNAGKGAVFTHEGKNELDASIMEGREKRAGAVASVTTIKNPVSAARAVMEKSVHVFLVGDGAEKFAKAQKLEMVKPSYFFTKPRWKELQDEIKKSKSKKELIAHRKWGTVGAVALDKSGTLAAATSTGGLTNKMHGRVGDSPIIGAGTYADNDGAAVSCTGHGEYFIRFHVASQISELVKSQRMTLAEAAHHMLFNVLNDKAGEGAAISLDKKGNIALESNSPGMLRGYVTKDGKYHAFVYETECPTAE